MSEVALVWGALSMCKPAKRHMPGEVNTFFWNIFKSNQMDILVLKIKFERSVPEFLFGRLWNILTGPVRAIQLGQNRMPLQHNSGRASIKYFRTFLRIMLLDCLMRDLYTTIGRHWGCLTQKGDIGVLPQQLRNKFFFTFLKNKVKHTSDPAWLKLLHWARRTWGDAGEVPGGGGGEADAPWTWIGGPWILIGGGAVLPLDAAGGGKKEETSLKKMGRYI